MRVKSTPVSSLKQESPHFSGTRTRKKHKRLDAICEDTYKRNHAESSKGVSENGVVGDDAELRRSSRARRAPVILDASPPPPKKRKKIEKDVGESVEKSTKLVSPQVKESEVESLEDVETPGSWKSRLRVRRKYIRFGKMNDYDMKSPRRKRKLFVEMDREGNEEKQLQRAPNEEKVKVVRKTMEFEVGFSVKKSRRRGRGKRANLMGGEKKADGSNLVKENNILDNGIGGTRRVDGETIPEDSETGNQNEKPGASDDYDDEKAVIGGDDDDEKAVTSDDDEEEEDEEKAVTSDDDDDDDEEEEEEEKAVTSDDDVEVIEEEVKGLDGAVQINEESHRNDVVVPAEQTEDVSGRVEVVAEEIPEKSNEVVAEKPGNKLEERSHDGKDMNSSQLHEKPIENGNNTEKDALIHHSMESLPLSGIKGGRRCGLCGGCNDGKPPKKLVLDMVESDNEACNGSSASEEPIYDTLDGFGDEPGWLGRLLGPINDRYGIAGIWVHQHCAVWSPEVYFAGLGCLKNVRAALCRGRALKCSRCGRPGATIGCRVDRCPKTYHLPCARAVGCIFDHRKFLIACTDHRHIFQPHNNNLIHMKRLKIKKMKQTYRKISNEACRKDIETEEKWLENCGEDEEFLRREGKRLHRDLLRISPVYIGGTESESGQLFQGWESVAGLQDVIRCMKEVVILPLLYPNFFDNLGITPPRGILLHGYPGTGKTLVVRALIGSIARGDKRIAYFARKGADCLGKYVGDAERQLRLLFQVAEKCQPSIIFFDEIDGLAPVRTKQQDQTHSSVVSTLLALLDGLKSRGSVVVIGATNRPDAVDPALRRPGRFDREIYFPLPSLEDRAAILSLHTQKWPKPVSEPLLGWLTTKTAGFAGADLQALCTQAAMVALKRNFPLHEVLTAAGNSSHGGVDRTPLPSFSVEERDWLEALSRSPPPCSRREAGIAANDILSSPLPVHLVPCLLNPLSNLLVSLFLDERLCLPPALSRAAAGIANVIFSAMDRGKLARDQWRFHIDSLMQEANVSKEIERELSSAGILSGQLNGDAFTDNECTKSDCSLSYNFSTHAGSLRNFTFASRNKSGYRLLISGSPGSGQKHLASCILHCYIGNVEVQKVDLATVSQEGHGDMVQGISRILMKCANAGSSVLFMPRIDLWAMEKKHQDLNDESNYHSLDHNLLDERVACPVDSQVCKMDIHVGGTKESQDDFISASHIWNSFVEQVESICVNTSLVIVATSAVPFDALPRRITKCFSNDKLDGGRFAHLEGALPRFSVDIDVDVNCGLVIDQSAAKISRDLIQQFVQLIHQRAHNTICKESSLSTAYCTSITNDIAKHKLPNEQAPGTQRSDDNLVKTSAVSSKRNMKGKSSLMQAILTFGYQILQYPHFAELCWVTSKLKEGPIADVNGPWKSWPFNSCIVRPDSLAEKTSGSFNSSNVKSKEKSGLVRGLVAVGLSAYRGLYSSATEVSLQIRWVLELLVQQINERIQAGKDRYQFVRILSQVSYLEDMVSSWAYSLKSLEMDAQVTSTRVLATAAISPDSHAPHDPFSNGMHEQQAAARASTNIEVPEGICPGLTVGNTKSAELMENTAQCDQNGPLGTIVLPEEDSPDNATLLAGSEVHENPHHSVNANKLADKTSMVCDVRNMARELEGTVNSEAMFEKSGISGQSSGSALSNSSIPDKEGSSPAKPGTADCSNFHNLINQQSGLDSRNTGINGVLTSDRSSMHKSSFTNNAGNSDFVCSYLCCSKCLCSLHAVMRKLLIQEWGLNTSLSVEDVHDAVASLSVDLVSTLRRCYFSDNSSELLGGERCLSISSLNLLMCQCRKSINSLTVAEECTSHSDGGSTNTDGDDSPSSEFGINVEFIMRNGVLTTVDFEKDVTFHCKYKILCLHPLLELVRNRTSL